MSADRRSRQALVALLLIGGVLLGSELTQGWYPHDEGVLGQSAERILAGEHPHRDFDETYTGLLGYLHAAVFAIAGPGSVPMRIPLFAAALAWLWAMYRIMLRFAPPAGAALIALVAFVWSVPNYPAPLPSWYLLFAATFGALAMVRWHEGGERRWLVLAGVMGAVAFLMKLSGLLFILGAGLALLATEERMPADGGAPAARWGDRYAWGVTLLVLPVMLALAIVVGRGGDREFLRFAVPITLITLGLVARVFRADAGAPAARWRALRARVTPLAVGAVAPSLAFIAFFALIGGLPEFVEGVFVAPFRRVSFAAMRPPAIVSLLFAAPVALVLWLRPRQRAVEWGLVAATGLGALAALVLSGADHRWYQLGWYSAWGLLFVVAVELARRLRSADEPGDPRRAIAITLGFIAVAVALVEYPFAAPIYTVYALPLSLLAVSALVRLSARPSVARQVVVASAFLAFGLLRILPGTPNNLGLAFARSTEITPLELSRSGLRIDPREAALYEVLVELVREHAGSRAIWAGPDSPEVYFLTGMPNRTRTLFDFLDAPAMSARPLVERLDALDVGVVVIKRMPLFSPPPSPALIDSLRTGFPQERSLPGFLVLWR